MARSAHAITLASPAHSGHLRAQNLGETGMRMARLLLAAALALAVNGSANAASPKAAVRAWRQAHEKEILADFVRLLSMPNVATTVPDVEKNAAYIAGLLQKRGFRTELLTAEPGTPPSVLAELKTPGATRT